MRQRRPEERRESRIEFLGEQDGVPERGLKSALTPILAKDTTIERAYLARVGFQPQQRAAVALCLAGPREPAPAVLRGIQECFAGMFRTGAALDILALSPEQESDAQRVCSPFYVRAV
jgi:hypothetical protein